jgi:hypothetical protein
MAHILELNVDHFQKVAARFLWRGALGDEIELGAGGDVPAAFLLDLEGRFYFRGRGSLLYLGSWVSNSTFKHKSIIHFFQTIFPPFPVPRDCALPAHRTRSSPRAHTPCSTWLSRANRFAFWWQRSVGSAARSHIAHDCPETSGSGTGRASWYMAFKGILVLRLGDNPCIRWDRLGLGSEVVNKSSARHDRCVACSLVPRLST